MRFVLALTIIALLTLWAHAAYAVGEEEVARGWVFIATPSTGCQLRTNDMRAIRLFINYIDGRLAPGDFIDLAALIALDWALVAESLVGVCASEVKHRGERV